MVTDWQFHIIHMITNQIPQIFIKEWVRSDDMKDAGIKRSPSHGGLRCECRNKMYIPINVNDTTQKRIQSAIVSRCQAPRAFSVKPAQVQGQE